MYIIRNAEEDSINFSLLLFEQEKDLLLSSDATGRTRVFVSAENFKKLDQRMRNQLKSLNIAKIKVFSKDKKIIYSTDHIIIGKIDDENEELIGALNGTVSSNLEKGEELWDLNYEKKLELDLVETYTPIKDINGDIIGSFEIYTNITKYRREIKQVALTSIAVVFIVLVCAFGFLFTLIKRAVTELEITHKEIEKKNQQLSKLDALKSQFVANVSHELKNPLGTVENAFTYIMRAMNDKMNTDQKKALKITKDTIDRLIRLTTDLLDISRIESGKTELRKERVVTGSLLSDILAAHEADFSKKQITLKRNIPQDTGNIFADKDKISQVIINVLSNAIKYTPIGGRITVTLNETDKTARLEISDTGPGIKKEYRHKIFDKFERIMAEKDSGTGLGLSVAKDIVDLHRGKIWVEDEIGKGSKFIIVLPKADNKL